MNAALLRRQRRRFDWSCQFFWHSAIAPAYRVTAARNRRKPKFGHDHIIPSKASWDDCLCPKAANGNPVHKNPSDRPVPAKSSVQIEIVAFTEPQPVTFPGHADSTFVSARLFPGSCLSASRDSCSPTSASGVVRQNSSRDPRRGGSWWSRQAVIGSIEQEDSGGGQPACAWSAHI